MILLSNSQNKNFLMNVSIHVKMYQYMLGLKWSNTRKTVTLKLNIFQPSTSKVKIFLIFRWLKTFSSYLLNKTLNLTHKISHFHQNPFSPLSKPSLSKYSINLYSLEFCGNFSNHSLFLNPTNISTDLVFTKITKIKNFQNGL